MFFQLAQDLTKIVAPDELAKGDEQAILAWVIGGMIVLYGVTVTYFIKRNGSGSGLTGQQHSWLKDLFEVHLGPTAVDAEGVRKWYVPRVWGVLLAGMTTKVQEIWEAVSSWSTLADQVKDLQDRLDTEQRERREEALRLSAEQKDIYRESMTTMSAVAGALEENTKAIDRIREHYEEDE